MRATVVQQYGGAGALRLSEVAEPEPGPGTVAIAVAYAGVNYAEVMARRGSLPAFAPPFVPGLEVSGIVRAVGPGVTGLERGQPVAALTTRGGYAEIALAPAELTFALRDGSDDELLAGAARPTIVPTAWALIHEVARLRDGESVLVHAAGGGVGTVVGQFAAAAGASKILGVVSSAAKARYALGFGYHDVFTDDAWPQHARLATGGRGPDVVLDSIGGDVRVRGLELLAPLGRLVCFGNACDEPESAIPVLSLRTHVKSVLGWSITGLAAADPVHAGAIARRALAAADELGVRVDITDVIPLAQAARAHECLEDRRSTGKLVLAVGTA
jgi:NADPH:quinone reductase